MIISTNASLKWQNPKICIQKNKIVQQKKWLQNFYHWKIIDCYLITLPHKQSSQTRLTEIQWHWKWLILLLSKCVIHNFTPKIRFQNSINTKLHLKIKITSFCFNPEFQIHLSLKINRIKILIMHVHSCALFHSHTYNHHNVSIYSICSKLPPDWLVRFKDKCNVTRDRTNTVTF